MNQSIKSEPTIDGSDLNPIDVIERSSMDLDVQNCERKVLVDRKTLFSGSNTSLNVIAQIQDAENAETGSAAQSQNHQSNPRMVQTTLTSSSSKKNLDQDTPQSSSAGLSSSS